MQVRGNSTDCWWLDAIRWSHNHSGLSSSNKRLKSQSYINNWKMHQNVMAKMVILTQVLQDCWTIASWNHCEFCKNCRRTQNCWVCFSYRLQCWSWVEYRSLKIAYAAQWTMTGSLRLLITDNCNRPNNFGTDDNSCRARSGFMRLCSNYLAAHVKESPSLLCSEWDTMNSLHE